MGTEPAGGILQGLGLALGQQVLDEAAGAHVGAQRRRRGGLQSHGPVQPAQSQQAGDLTRGLVGMIGIGEDPVGQQPERAAEAGCRTVASVAEAVKDAEVVILAVWHGARER